MNTESPTEWWNKPLLLTVLTFVATGIGSVIWWNYTTDHQEKREDEKAAEQKQEHKEQQLEQASKEAQRICNEFDSRYELFKQHMDAGDVAGAIAAFNSPHPLYSTADVDLARRSSASLLRELSESAIQPSTWPPSLNSEPDVIRETVGKFMSEVERHCK